MPITTPCHQRLTAPVTCPTCKTTWADCPVEADELVGCVAVLEDTAECGDCAADLCPECPQFVCPGCKGTFCEEHARQQDGHGVCPACAEGDDDD